MKAVIQRVSKASVTVDDTIVAAIDYGLLILLGIEDRDTTEDIEWLVSKIVKLRIFSDTHGQMNVSLKEKAAEALIVSQFTLHASTKKGNRPSFIKAAKPDVAIPLYEQFVSTFEKLLGKPVSTGKFGAMMEVELINDGPVTLVIDTKNKE